jgi:hypothetical protein
MGLFQTLSAAAFMPGLRFFAAAAALFVCAEDPVAFGAAAVVVFFLAVPPAVFRAMLRILFKIFFAIINSPFYRLLNNEERKTPSCADRLAINISRRIFLSTPKKANLPILG